MPGCESMTASGANAYDVVMTAAIGPVKARFKGRMLLTDIEAPNSYTIVFEGQGGAAGFGKGNTRVTLEPEGDAATITLSPSRPRCGNVPPPCFLAVAEKNTWRCCPSTISATIRRTKR